MKLISIVALDRQGVIGIDGKMPWHIPADLKWFKNCTLNCPIIMGKNTYVESLGKTILSQRTNIVVSSSLSTENTSKQLKIVPDLETALDLARQHQTLGVAFIIGGGKLYSSCIDLCSHLIVTRIDKEYKGDTYFPKIQSHQWRLTNYGQPMQANGINFRFECYQRILTTAIS